MNHNQPANRRQRLVDIFSRGLTSQLLTTIILPSSILLILITFGGLRIHQQAMRELASARDERTARALSSAIESQVRLKIETLKMISYEVSRSEARVDHITPLEGGEAFDDIFNAGLGLLDHQGNLTPLTPEFNLWDDTLDPNTITSLAPQYTRAASLPIMIEGKSDERPVPLLWMALYLEAQDSYLIGGFSPSEMIDSVVKSAYPDGQGNVVYVLGTRGEYLYRHGTYVQIGFQEKHIQEILNTSDVSGATYVQSGGEEHVIAYSFIPITGWVVLIEEPWESVASPLLRLTENAPLVLIPIVILAFVGLWLASRRIVQPLQNLEAQAVELGWGNFTAIEKPVGGIMEIQNLQNELIKLARTVHASQQGLRNYINAITLGQEEERRRLARELHDETLQSLIALNQRIQLALLSIEEGKTEDLTRKIEEIQQLNSQTIQNLRRISHGLRPIYLEELGLSAALEMLAGEIEKSYNLSVTFTHAGEAIRLPPNVELALYRMAQEALNNILKHAKASWACISIESRADKIILEIQDNGIGFKYTNDPSPYFAGGHYGLLGLRERAEMIGAQLEIHSQANKGTRIRILLDQPRQAVDRSEVQV